MKSTNRRVSPIAGEVDVPPSGVEAGSTLRRSPGDLRLNCTGWNPRVDLFATSRLPSPCGTVHGYRSHLRRSVTEASLRRLHVQPLCNQRRGSHTT